MKKLKMHFIHWSFAIRVIVFTAIAVAALPIVMLYREWYLEGLINYYHNMLDEAERIGIASKDEIDELRKEI